MAAAVRLAIVSALVSTSLAFVQHYPSQRPCSTRRAADNSLWPISLERFQGDFDNYHQVVEDRRQGLLPKAGGGHENIHCTLVPVDIDSRLAAFYFDGTPSAIFRFRYYRLEPVDDDENEAVDTILYTLHPQLEGQLRQHSQSPLEWPRIFGAFAAQDKIRLLPGCNVRWSWQLDPQQHEYAINRQERQAGIHAVMIEGSALVDSQLQPGQQILIKDQLSLWPDALWIHDRGFDPDTGDFIYGNQRNVPYQLDRVANLGVVDGQLQRTVVDATLQWTLGEAYRTADEYAERVAGMGGPSIPSRPAPLDG